MGMPRSQHDRGSFVLVNYLGYENASILSLLVKQSLTKLKTWLSLEFVSLPEINKVRDSLGTTSDSKKFWFSFSSLSYFRMSLEATS